MNRSLPQPRPTGILGFVVLLTAAVLGGCSRDGADNESALDRMKRTGAARVGFANEAPFAYIDRTTGRLTGEAPEIARVVLTQLGIQEIEGVLTEFGSLIPALQADRFDLIAAGMYITPERCREVLFSNPTYRTGEAFIVRTGNPKGLHSYEDVRIEAETTLGVVVGTVEQQYARKLEIPDARVMIFPDPPSALAGILAGRIDAFAGTALTVNDLLSKSDSQELERAEPFTDPVIEGVPARGYGAFAFRKDSTALKAAFDQELASFLGGATHQALVRPFGFTQQELPDGVTADELCGAVP